MRLSFHSAEWTVSGQEVEIHPKKNKKTFASRGVSQLTSFDLGSILCLACLWVYFCLSVCVCLVCE